ncbi:ommochrome-binding protein-like [Aphomia sociella]
MKLLLVLCCLITIKAGVVKEDSSKGVCINDVYYDKEVLKTHVDVPFLLAIDRTSNNLYFSYSITDQESAFTSARLDLNTTEFNIIKNVSGGFAQTVDEKTQDVYIGGDNGLYKYDASTNEVKFIGVNNTSIWSIYYNDVLYFSAYPSKHLYTFSNGESSKVPGFEDIEVEYIVIDNDSVIFYSNETGLYSKKKGTQTSVQYKGVPEEDKPKALIFDVNGNLYICYPGGIYSVNKENSKIEKYVALDDLYGAVFDSNNNIVYSDTSSIIRLTSNKDKSC